jgi:NADH:ubiquinone oxidoreductase subunit 3 (subunit A)
VVESIAASSAVFNYAGVTRIQAVVLLFFASLAFVVLLYTINKVLVRVLLDNRGSLSYECGFAPFSAPVCNMQPQFAPIALMFLVYDVDMLLLFP